LEVILLFANVSNNTKIASDNAENKTEKPTSDLQNARFFVIKSFCEDDVHKVIALIECKRVINTIGYQV